MNADPEPIPHQRGHSGNSVDSNDYKNALYHRATESPFRDCLTSVTVRDLGRGQGEVTWAATFAADGLPASEAMEMLEGAFESNSRALRRSFYI